MIIDLLIFLQVLGVICSNISVWSFLCRFKSHGNRKPITLTFITLIPVLNWYLAWETTKEYQFRVTLNQRKSDTFMMKTARVNHGKGIKFNG